MQAGPPPAALSPGQSTLHVPQSRRAARPGPRQPARQPQPPQNALAAACSRGCKTSSSPGTMPGLGRPGEGGTGGQPCPCKPHSGTAALPPSSLTQRWCCSFLSLPLSLGGDLWRKMHNMFYLPCGSHKIFTSSSHYSQSESQRALKPSLPDVPPPMQPWCGRRAPAVVVPGPDERPVLAWIPQQGPTFPPPGLGDTPGLGRSRGGDRADGIANTFARLSILMAAQGEAASTLRMEGTSATGSRSSWQRGGLTCPQQPALSPCPAKCDLASSG